MTLPFVPPSRPRTHTPSKPAPLCAAAAEDALVKAGALQKAIFDSANFSSIATDANGVIQIFNVGAERMLGYTAAEVMNKITPADISDPDEVITRAKTLSAELDTPITPGFEALVFKARRGIEDIYELTYIRKDGSRFPAVVSVTALRDARDAIIGYLLIGTDNTARKQAEDALVKAGALQKAIFDSANFSSIATDANGVIQIFNVGAERMLGYTAAEVMNKITPADISDPDEVITRAKTLSAELDTPITPGFEALVFKARRGIEDIYELTYIRKDGSRFPAVVSVTALRDARDAIIGYLLIGTDNTARKQAAQLLEAVNEELRQFVSVASHDLRQPLRMVTSYLNLIEKRLPPQSLTDDIKEFLGYAVGGAKRMDSMILGLLEYSSTGKSAAMVPVPLADAVADALSNLTLAIREADAEIVVVEGLPTVTGNMTELTRLFQNLIGNAVKYHAPGRSPKIEIDWSRTGSDWLILIKDNGIGIAPEDRERAFGIFQRLVTQDAYEGTGIGLAVCKKIVEHHNGRIWIESALNEGTTFFLALRNGSAAP